MRKRSLPAKQVSQNGGATGYVDGDHLTLFSRKQSNRKQSNDMTHINPFFACGEGAEPVPTGGSKANF
jgi:hypothetical protein